MKMLVVFCLLFLIFGVFFLITFPIEEMVERRSEYVVGDKFDVARCFLSLGICVFGFAAIACAIVWAFEGV